MNRRFLEKIIQDLDTKTSCTTGTSGNKNYRVNQDMIDKFGRESVIDSLREMEAKLPAGSIKVKWVNYPTPKRDAYSFSIRKERIDDICALAGKKSTRDKLSRARNVIEKRISSCKVGWLTEGYYKRQLAQIDHGTEPKGWEDEDLDLALRHVAENTQPMFERNFSIIHFGQSKVFGDRYKQRVCSIIKRACPEVSADANHNELLRAFNILTYSLTAEFRGPAVYTLNDAETEYSAIDFYPGITLNTEAILHAKFKRLDGVKNVVTIENKANYEAQKYDPETLYIFVHGYMSPREVLLYSAVNDILPDAQYLHWGDLDYGGINIFRFLKNRVFPRIKPFHMDLDAYDRYSKISAGYKIKPSTLKLLKDMDAGELEPLKAMILKTGIGFEQEAML